MNIIWYANQEDDEKGWDGTYLERFIEWTEDHKGIIADDEMTKAQYDFLRWEYDNHGRYA